MARERKGSIVERDGKVYARITYVDGSGARKDKWRRAENRTHARQISKHLLREMADTGESSLAGDRMTFRDLAHLYEERKLIPAKYVGGRKVAGLRSVGPVKAALYSLIDGFGGRRLKVITHSDVEKYKLQRLDTPTVRGARSIASVNRELELMRAMMRFAQREGWITRNPFERGSPLISKSDETQRERVLSYEEERRLLAACTGRRAHLRPLLIAALDTAMRRGELFKLRWRDVNFENHIVTVVAMNSKTARGRSVAMTLRLYDVLRNIWEYSPQNVDGLVFGVTDTIKNGFASACKTAGIEGFRFHDCRHTAITRMVAAGVAPMEVMKVSGHTQMTTFARYVNPTQDTVRRAADLLSQFNESVGAQEATELIN